VADDVLVLAVADGAGSARMSRVGAQTAVNAATSHAAQSLETGLTPRDAVWESLHHARSMVKRVAASLGGSVDLTDLSCTLLVAVVGPFGLATAQIGDGAIVVGFDGDRSLANLTPPSTAEYLNVTDFLTSDTFREAAVIRYLDEQPDRLALMTDGVEHIAITGLDAQPEQRFFEPLFDRLSRGELHHAQVTKLFRSPRVAAKTDDDMTLTLVCRSSLHE